LKKKKDLHTTLTFVEFLSQTYRRRFRRNAVAGQQKRKEVDCFYIATVIFLENHV